jgi:hypothetical protein
MKYYKRLKLYKASNVTFNPETMVAYSYGWWEFVKVIDGKVVFNNYYYSTSTCKHQSKVMGLLSELGIKIDMTIECPGGLQNLQSAVEHYTYEIKELERKIAAPRTHKKKNEERKRHIDQLHEILTEINNVA